MTAFCSSCSNDSNMAYYTLNVHSDLAKADSVELLVYEPEYNSLRMLNSGQLKKGTLVLTGQICQSLVALIKIGKSEPLPFILEKCETDINISKERAIVWGGIENHAYIEQCTRIYNFERQIKNIELEYKRRIADSTLNKNSEGRLLRKHNALVNAMHKTISNAIKSNDNASLLIKEKFINKLDSTSFTSLQYK